MSATATEGAAGAGTRGGELARMLATLAWILAATALSVTALGAVPGWVAGESARVRHVDTIEEAERRLGARVLVPGYFPDRLDWPPAEIRVAGGRRGSALLVIAPREGGEAVEILQATRDGAPIAAELLEGRTVLRTSPARVGDAAGTLSDVLVHGRPARELAWVLHGRAVILRSAGDLEELFRMARSAHREGGR